MFNTELCYYHSQNLILFKNNFKPLKTLVLSTQQQINIKKDESTLKINKEISASLSTLVSLTHLDCADFFESYLLPNILPHLSQLKELILEIEYCKDQLMPILQCCPSELNYLELNNRKLSPHIISKKDLINRINNISNSGGGIGITQTTIKMTNTSLIKKEEEEEGKDIVTFSVLKQLNNLKQLKTLQVNLFNSKKISKHISADQFTSFLTTTLMLKHIILPDLSIINDEFIEGLKGKVNHIGYLSFYKSSYITRHHPNIFSSNTVVSWPAFIKNKDQKNV